MLKFQVPCFVVNLDLTLATMRVTHFEHARKLRTARLSEKMQFDFVLFEFLKVSTKSRKARLTWKYFLIFAYTIDVLSLNIYNSKAICDIFELLSNYENLVI